MDSTALLNFQNLMASGREARARGDRAAALAAFESAAALNGQHIGVKVDIAFELRALGRLEQARDAFVDVVRQAPDLGGAHAGLGHTLRQLGDRAGALAAFEAAAAAEPKNAGLQVDLGHELREAGRLEAAEAAYRAALAREAENLPALIGLARVQRQRHDREGALATLETAAKVKPDAIAVRIESAYLLRDLGRLGEAEEAFRAVLAGEPRNLGALVGLGYLLRDAREREGAIAAFRSAAEIDPANMQVRLEIAYLLRDMGRPEAEAAFRDVLAADPRYLPGLLGLAQAQKARGDRDAALATFEAALAAHPGHAGARVQYAYLLRDVGEVERAEAAFQAILEDEPRHAGALIGLGYLYMDMYALEKAESAFRRALAADHDDEHVRIALGHLARRRGDRASALLSFEAAIAVNPSSLEAKLERAVEFRDLGLFAQTRLAIERILEENPAHLQSWLQLGQLHRRVGDRQAALRAFKHAHDIEPGNIQTLLDEAVEQRALGKPHEATRLVEQALKRDENHLGALLQHAEHAMLTEDYENAVAIAQHAISHHPRKFWPYMHAARALAETGDQDAANDVLSRAEAMCGPQPEIAATRVQLRRQIRDLPAAKKILGDTNLTDQSSFFLWSERAMVAIGLADYEAAGKLMENPPSTSTKDLGRVFLFKAQLAEAQRRYEDAIAAYREAVRLDPTDSWSHAEIARACMILLNLDEAQKHLKQSIDLNASTNIMRGQSLNVSQHHLGQILDEFLLDRDLVTEMKAAQAKFPAERVEALRQLVNRNPESTGPALLFVIALRQAGLLSERAGTPNGPTIPRRVVQFWDSPEPPPDISTLMKTWQSCNPAYEYLLFNDLTAKTFIQKSCSRGVLHAYLRSQHPAQRADIFRLAFLAVNGGIYADSDDKCLAPIDSFMPAGTNFIAYQENYGTIGNNFIGTVSQHQVIVRALEVAAESINRGDNDLLWLSTGPGLLTRAFATIVSRQKSSDELAGWTVRELGEMQRVIGFHCPVHYKRTERHWSRAATKRKVALRFDQPAHSP